MKEKNNKGFTLIEVIAVVAIIGILSILVVPRIYDLVTNSRSDVYVQDAIRMIASAQYTMNSKSVKIDKPDNGECIVFSLKYLSSGDFQNPPNGGHYLTESSFVVVKNNNGEYVYSAMLVEQTKDGTYMGVEFSTETALSAKNASKHVRTFKRSEIAYFDENESTVNGGVFINANLINELLKKSGQSTDDWLDDEDSIVGYYNNEKTEDADIADTLSPKVSAKFSGNGSGGSLKTILTISATDGDDPTSSLKVYLKISDNPNDSYPDPSVSASVGGYMVEGYGNENFYTKEIDFSNYGFSYENKKTAYVYILVTDPNNNYTRKRMSYDIHENTKPEIDDFVIGLTATKYNMPKVTIRLVVKDDLDAIGDLKVCFVQDNNNATTCNGYKSYSAIFGSGNTVSYTFRDDDGHEINEPDGSSRQLKVFVKDSLGLVSTRELDYSIHQNGSPEITFIGMDKTCAIPGTGLSCGCSSSSCNGLDVKVRFTVKDDLTSQNDLKIKIYELTEDGKKLNTVSTTYEYVQNGQDFTFSGDYDGKDRKLVIEVTDEYGKMTPFETKLTNVYKDTDPVIKLKRNLPFAVSSEVVCTGTSECQTNGGSYEANLNFEVEDDLTPTGDLRVCVSEVESDCSRDNINDSQKFQTYANFSNHHTFSKTGVNLELPYPDAVTTKKLYAAVVDNKDHYVALPDSERMEYVIYHNSPPSITGKYEIKSTNDNRSLSSVQIVADSTNPLKVEDDFNDYSIHYCYYIDDEDHPICTQYQSFTRLMSQLDTFFQYTNADESALKYLGQTIHGYFEVKDNYGDVVKTSVKDYELFEDQYPNIKDTKIKSTESEYNSYIAEVSFTVEDYEDTYQICVTAADKECSEYEDLEYLGGDLETHSIVVDGNELDGWDIEYRNEDRNKQLKLWVKDSYGHVSSSTLNYEVYKLCSNPDKLKDTKTPYVYRPTEDGPTISAEYCKGACYKSIRTTNKSNHVNYIINNNDKLGNYYKMVVYTDTLVGYNCNIEETDTLGCDYVDCFDTGDRPNPNLIGMKLEDEDSLWYYSNSKVTQKVPVDKPYCDAENIGSDAYFYPGDARCTDEHLCENKATSVCTPIIDAEEQADIAERKRIMDEYDQAIATFDHERQVAWEAFLEELEDYTDEEKNLCTAFSNNLNDDEWVEENEAKCQTYHECQSCKEDPECSDYDDVECESPGENICEVLSIQDRCSSLSQLEVDFYSGYLATHTAPTRTVFLTQTQYDTMEAEETLPTGVNIYIIYDRESKMAECVNNKTEECKSYYSFCNNDEFKTYQKLVPCAGNADLTPIHCRNSGYLDGICLEDDTTCTAGDSDCRTVCYREYNCEPEEEVRPVIFTCHGYYKTYQSVKENGSIRLQETPLRICPDFMRLFPDFYQYNSADEVPFIQFNPDEITKEEE